MRRQPTEIRSQGTHVRSRDEGRGGVAKRSRLRRLTLESLEGRMLLAQLPMPLVSGQVTISNTNGNNNNNSTPFIAIDPLNPLEMVSVYTNRNTSNGTRIDAEATYSIDGGKNWTTLNLPGPLSDPTVTSNPPPLSQYAEGIGFDRNNHLYIGLLETNGGGNAGYVFMEKYDATNLATFPSSNQVYAWNQTVTGQNLQPGIVNFSMAVDGNVASYTDPSTSQVQADPNSGAVYIAWTLNTPPPTSPPSPYNPYTIQVVASPDGATWPAGGAGGVTGTAQAHVGGGNAGNQRYTDPRITVSQGKAGGTDGGLVSVIYDDYGSGTANGSNLDTIYYASLTNTGGSLGVNTSQRQIANTAVRGAQTGTSFPLATPSSPIGIGPGAQIAVDDTLGSFSTDQGRIYVTYVDKYTTTHGVGLFGGDASHNPADNTDIFLTFSDNDGQSWSTPRQVNDDAGATDGHTGATNGGSVASTSVASFFDGRPQYEPSIAVDPTTGTVALSWLDVRDDPSLARYADYITTSIDGGTTFSSQNLPSTQYTAAQLQQGVPQPFADQPNVVADAITGKTFVAGPYSGNESGSNPNSETSLSFGRSQGLAIYGGILHPVWSTTVQDGLGNFGSTGNNNERLTIETATATVAAGPRVVTGTMGVVGPTTVDGMAFNNVAAADGTEELTGFVVTFDRPVSIASFGAGQVHVYYNGTTSLTNTPVAVGTITALDRVLGVEATTFYVSLLVPQTAVGTYSYTVGPGVTDLMRTATPTGATLSAGNAMDQNADGVAGEASDLFVNPAPLSGVSIQAPFNEATEPLIIPGPHLVSSSVPGGVADPGSLDTTDTNLVVNGTVGSINVTFDRTMNASTFTAAQVLSITGPNGPISTAGIIITPAGNGKTFTISGFPVQTISGTYSVVLGSGITSSAGDKMDANENAGLDLLFQQSTPGDTTTTTTYAAGSTAIPAGTQGAPSQVTSTITVNDSYAITDLQLALDITYPTDADLAATLTFTPASTGIAGSPIKLFTNIGNVAGSKANFTNTFFTDATTINGNPTTAIDNGAPPYTGLFNPEQPFTTIINGQVQGTYTLTITNSGTGTGTLNDWSLHVTKTNDDTGLGEPVADQSSTGFRIFTMAATNTQSSNTWTAVGPASQNNTDNAGQATAIAIDPSDPSGNTVYVGGAGGGIWKTTNYLTSNPNGPTYIPLAQAGLFGSLNISSIAIFPQNNDPAQSVVIAGTGARTNSFDADINTSQGVGFLISYNGGKTWTLLDSTQNTVAGAEVPEPLSAAAGTTARDDAFVGTSVTKVLVDPKPQPGGSLIFYAAVSGTNAKGADEGGIWRSTDSGNTWQRMIAGNATDVTFDPNSGVINTISNPTGNLDVLYAAFGTGGATASGVYISPNKGQSWTPMTGGVGDPLILEDQTVNTPVPVVGQSGPTGSRIVLAKPALTGSTIQNDVASNAGTELEDDQYETWIYAASVDAGGNFAGLYVTKDNGANWTLIKIPTASFLAGPDEVVPTNNTGSPQYNLTRGLGLQSIAIAVDPNNPMVLYLGGTYDNGNPTAMIRVDISRLSDPYSLYASTETLGGQTLEQTTSPVSIFSPTALEGDGRARYPNSLNTYLEPDPLRTGANYINILRNPNSPFNSNASFFVAETAGFANDGSGAWWTPFTSILDDTTDVNAIVAVKDPLTGKTRLLVADDQGTFSGVDDGTGKVLASVGGADGGRALPTGSRNGNLQIAQFFNGASQPSTSAAAAAGHLFYGASAANADPSSDPNILTNGDLNWTTGLIGVGAGETAPIEDYFGTDVATDQTGTGQGYYSVHPAANPIGHTDFFQVGTTESGAIGRTFGLIQSSTGGGVTNDPQWPDNPSFDFVVNPVNNQDVIFGSGAGRLFGTENQGKIWFVIAQPTDLDGSVIPALAYGAPAPGASGSLDSYLLAGTQGGHIFVTFTGGGGTTGNAWANISAGLDGSSVERIITDPTRGTHDAYAITQRGVYYNADTAATGTTWVNITGNLFKLTINAFGDSSLTEQQLQSLDALAVDWRYVIPNPSGSTPTDPNAPTTHPLVYVAGQGGVFRTLDNGTTWGQFPDSSATPVPQGNLPIAAVTDLDMELGNIDPTTGHANTSTGSNVLLATTYGAGDYAILLSPVVFNTAANPLAFNASKLTFTGLSEQTAFGNAVTVTVEDVTDPANPIILGTGPTDAFGKFTVQGAYPTPPANNPFLYDGTRDIKVFATDGTGDQGNPVAITINNPLPTLTAPALVNADGTSSPLVKAVITGGLAVTTAVAPTFMVTLPGSGLTAPVSLIRIDSQGNQVIVKQASITGSGTIRDPGPVPVGTYTYKVTYNVTIDGHATDSPPSPGTTVKVAAQESIGLYSFDDSGTQGDGITNVTRPRFVVSTIPNTAADANLQAQIVVVSAPSGSGLSAGSILASTADPSTSPFLLQPSTALADGTYSVIARTKDGHGDVVDSPALTLTISTAGPTMVPTLALLPASIVPAGNPNVTTVRRPTVFGQTDPGSIVNIYQNLNGNFILLATTTASQFKNGSLPAGYFQAQLPSNLNDGTIQLAASAQNAAGNTNPTKGTLTLKITTAPGDYNDAGKAGLAVYSPGTGNYSYSHSGTWTTVPSFGLPNVDIPVPGDYNGDGRTDPAIYRPTNGYWAIDENGQAGQSVVYVSPIVPPGTNVIPAPGEFDADGQTDPAVYYINSAGSGFYTILHNLVTSGSGSTQTIAWGLAGDSPVAADFDGAGSAQVAVYRTGTGAWYIRSSGVGGGAGTAAGKQEPAVFVTPFQAGDQPDAADYDGINRAEEAIFRPSNETFYIYNPITKATRSVTMPKLPDQGSGDVIIPVSADYTADGKADPAIYDQTLGIFEVVNSATGQVTTAANPNPTPQDIATQSPYHYRAAANSATPASRAAGSILAASPASTGSTASSSAGQSGSSSASAAVVIGAPIPTGSTSTGKSSTLPTGTVAKSTPIVLVTSSARPAQDAAGSAIDSLGKSYNGLFI